MENSKITSIFQKKKKWIFYWAIIALPLLQFCIFYIGVNFNSILLAFKEYNMGVGKFESAGYTFAGFSQFKECFTQFKTSPRLSVALKNSLLVYGVTTLSMSTLTIWFAYYIFKRKFASGVFRIILFLPQVISPLVMSVMFKSIAEVILPELFTSNGIEVKNLLSNPNTRFATTLFYNIWVSFGTSILLYNGNMASIDPEVLEAGRMDGAEGFREFIYIIFPLVYPTFCTFFVVHIAGIFTNQMGLHGLYGLEAYADMNTFGYYLFVEVSTAGLSQYPYLSALGLMMTLVAVPLTLLVRWGMNRIGPSVD